MTRTTRRTGRRSTQGLVRVGQAVAKAVAKRGVALQYRPKVAPR